MNDRSYSDIVERLEAAYQKVSFYPETRTDGLMDLLALRNLVPEAVAALRGGAARTSEPDDAEPIEKIGPQSVEITGPYLYVGDKHPSLRLAAPDRIVASVYVVDGDEDRAFAEAQMIKEAFRLGGKEIDRLHYASGVAQPASEP